MIKYSNQSYLCVMYHRLFKNYLVIFIIPFLLFLSSCVQNRSVSLPISSNLITNVRIEKPILPNAIKVKVPIKVEIFNHYRIEESIEESLQEALEHSNIFGNAADKAFEIVVDIIHWHIPDGDIGMFPSQLKTRYVLLDDRKNIILNQVIESEARSDEWFFLGYRRANRSASLTVSQNVNKIIDSLKNNLKNKYDSRTQQNIVTEKSSLAEELEKLSELYNAGVLTNEEFIKAKDKLLNPIK